MEQFAANDGRRRHHFPAALLCIAAAVVAIAAALARRRVPAARVRVGVPLRLADLIARLNLARLPLQPGEAIAICTITSKRQINQAKRTLLQRRSRIPLRSKNTCCFVFYKFVMFAMYIDIMYL